MEGTAKREEPKIARVGVGEQWKCLQYRYLVIWVIKISSAIRSSFHLLFTSDKYLWFFKHHFLSLMSFLLLPPYFTFSHQDSPSWKNGLYLLYFLNNHYSSITAIQLVLQPLHKNYLSILIGDILIAKLNSNVSFLFYLTFLNHLAQVITSFLKRCHLLTLAITFSKFSPFLLVIWKFP